MFFWFIGVGVIIFKYIFKDKNADLRFLIVGLLILDIMDILLAVQPIGKDQKFVTHSLLLSVFTMFLIMLLTKRGTKTRKNLLLFSIGTYLHLFLDFMWLDQSTFLFPLPFESNEIFNKSTTLIIIQEIIGLAYFIYKIKDNSFKTFIRSGII
ncbi:hypothetical protein N9Y09_01560 [Candidatus Actinomarina sp.]|nr:hypothetical protein [Candidatus Actinomarina sp.]